MRYSAVLLAGGKSSRMGRDKAFLDIDGQPLGGADGQFVSSRQRNLCPVATKRMNECEVVSDAVENAGHWGIAALGKMPRAASHRLAVDLPM